MSCERARVGRITASEHPYLTVGDYVYGSFGVQEYALSDGQGVSKIDITLAEPASYLGALGMTGLTAYFGPFETAVRGPANYLMLLVARASMTGMVIFDYADQFGPALAELAGWYQAGLLAAREYIVPGGVRDFPEVLLQLFDGANTGKMVLALDKG
jgi:NADPH-dependent curcumin reductase CurA